MKPRPPSKEPRLEGDALVAHMEALLSETEEERSVKVRVQHYHAILKPDGRHRRGVPPRDRLRRTEKRYPGLLKDLRKHLVALQSDVIFRVVRKEVLARQFRVSQGRIEACLAQLNREGIVEQARHARGDSSWYPDFYRLVPTGARSRRLREKRRR